MSEDLLAEKVKTLKAAGKEIKLTESIVETTLNLYDPDKIAEPETGKMNKAYQTIDSMIERDAKGTIVGYKKGNYAEAKLFEVKVNKELRCIESKVTKYKGEALVERIKLAEALGDPFDNDLSVGNSFDEYLPLLGGPFSKQLYLFDYLDMHRKCFEASNHNPVARQIINITTRFVLGRGVSGKAKSKTVQDCWDRFEKKNKLNRRLDDWCSMITRDGEIMIRKFKNPITSEPTPRWIDPSTIWEIVTDPEDIEKVYYYHQQYPAQYQVLYDSQKNIPSTTYIINQIPADDVLHYKLNCSPNEKRGRSDLFPVLGWLKRLKDYYNAKALKSILQASFVWKNKIKGDAGDIDAFISKFGTKPPSPGSLWVENEASELSAMGADSGSSSARGDMTGDEILNMIAIGVGIPKEYLGLGDKSTRATALVATEPGAKKFQDRQKLIEQILIDIWEDYVQWALLTGILPKQEIEVTRPNVRQLIRNINNKDWFGAMQWLKAKLFEQVEQIPIDTTIEFTFPEIIIEDRTNKLKDLAVGVVQGWWSNRTAGTIAGKEMQISTYDYDEEQEELKNERSSRDASPAELSPEEALKRADKKAEQVPAKASQAITSEEKNIIKDNK